MSKKQHSHPDTIKHTQFQLNKERIIEHLVHELRSGRIGVLSEKLQNEARSYAGSVLKMPSKEIETAIRRKCVVTAVRLYSKESKSGKKIAEGFLKRRRDAAKDKLAESMKRHQTPSEKAMRSILDRNFGPYGFSSQVVIFGYIPDFYSMRTKVIVEVDGSFHDGRKEYDSNRDMAFLKKGIRTFRFSAEDVLERPDEVIKALCEKLPAPPAIVQGMAKEPPIRYRGRGKRPIYAHSDGQLRAFRVCHEMAVGTVYTKGKRITSTPPIWQWSVGKQFNCLLMWLEKKGSIPEVTQDHSFYLAHRTSRKERELETA